MYGIFYTLSGLPEYNPSGDMTTMHQFKISETGFKKFRKKWLATVVPLVAIVVLIIAAMNILSAKADPGGSFLFVIPVMAVVLSFSFYRSLRKQRKFLLSYSVTVSGEGITREQMNTPPLSISFMEIKEIIKNEKGGFTIKGLTRTDIIHIPYLIDNQEELEKCLQSLAPITVNTKDPFYKKYRALLSIPILGMMICVYAMTNKVIVGICSVLLTAFLIWAFYQMIISKNIPRNTKRNSWVFLIIIFSIIYVTYAKLTGTWNPH
jgi:hypothetical protein